VLGIHLEGPFLNPGRKGAHDPALMRAMDAEDVALLTAPGAGRVLVTLAPEVVGPETIARLAAAGVIVSAGHTAASEEAIVAARAAGLTGFTHLFNAMPPLAARAPGPVGAALADANAWAGLIVDLHHVAATSLRAAIAARGWQRTMLVSDAMPTVGSDLERFTLSGRTVTLDGGRLSTDEGTLAGANLDMATAVRNTVDALGLPLEAALAMASRAPAEFLGLGHELGRIAPGYRASLVLLDDDLRVTATWIDGQG
jgi:N-acetylglucosamine-6-phosphate deacetylase